MGNKSKKKTKAKTFKVAVEETKDVKSCYQSGLKALGGHSGKIELSDTTQCEGSVNIDDCTQAKYPTANRWDYAFAYKAQVYFVEVHTASTGEVRTVLRKLRWLKDWLNEQAPEISKMKAKDRAFFWVASNGYHILKNSSQYRSVIAIGLNPIPRLKM